MHTWGGMNISEHFSKILILRRIQAPTPAEQVDQSTGVSNITLVGSFQLQL